MDQAQSTAGFAPSPRLIVTLALAATGASAVLAFLRLYYNISFVEPLQYFSSGDEQSSLLAIWRAAMGLSPYTDRYSPPFALASYNWLYYQAYAIVFRMASAAFSFGDPWLPTVGRLVTVGGALVAGIFSWLLLSAAAGAGRTARMLAACFAVLIAVGPLVGFWLITVRPDIWAFALEIVGLWIFARFYPEKRLSAVGAFAILFYAAWAFKQTAVLVGGGVGLFLLFRRDWRMAFLLAGTMLVLWSLTFLLAGAEYRNALLFSNVPLEYEAFNGLLNLARWAVKFAPGAVAAAVMVFLVAVNAGARRVFLRNLHIQIGLTGLAVSLALAFPASMQTGASDNYFFQAALFSAYLTVSGFAVLEKEKNALLRLGAGAGLAALTLAVGLVLGGVIGIKDMRPLHRAHMAIKSCLDELPRPLFVGDVYLSLPWMTPGTEPFVLSFFYNRERALGRPFEGDGIGGRIAAGRFAALAFWEDKISVGSDGVRRFDGASLEGYQRRPESCMGLVVWLRK